MSYASYKRRSLNWLLVAFLAFSTVGTVLGGLAFAAAGESAVAPAFLAPTIAGILLISRAYSEGRLAERASMSSGAQEDAE